jgi:hypothetical protein
VGDRKENIMKKKHEQLRQQLSGKTGEFKFCGLDHIPYNDDPALSKEAYDNWDKYQNTLEETLPKQDLIDSMLLLAQFDDNNDYLNLDEVFLHAIESHPQYPSVELFTYTIRNRLQSHLIARCFSAKLICSDESISKAALIIEANFTSQSVTELIDLLRPVGDSLNEQELFLLAIYIENSFLYKDIKLIGHALSQFLDAKTYNNIMPMWI